MKILIIDDNPVDRELIIRELKKEYPDAEFREITRRSDFDEALSRADFNAVITDFHLQWTDGLWILKTIKEQFPNIPVVMATDSGSEEIAVEGMKSGLDDYVLKRNLRRIPFAVRESLEKVGLQAALRESSNRMKLLLESTDEGILGIDANYRGIFFNRAAAKMTGYAPEEIMGKNMHKLMHHSYSDGTPYPIEKCPVFRTYKRGEGVRVDTEVLWRKDGTSFPAEFSSYPIIEDGTVKGAVITFVDITERKRAEEELRKARDELEKRVEERTTELSKSKALLEHEVIEHKIAEETLRELANRISLLLESTDEGIFGLDLEGHSTLFNRAAAKMTGYTPEEVLGKDLHKLIHHSRSDGSPYSEEECPIFHSLLTGRGVRLDTEVFWRKDGTSFPVEYSSYPIIDEGAIKGVVTTFTDISERKQAKQLSDAFNDINAAISATLDFDEIMKIVVVKAAKALGSEAAVIGLSENGSWVIKHVYGLPQEVVGTKFTEEDTPQAVIATRTRRPVVVDDAYHDERVNRNVVMRYQVRSLMMVPLMVRESVIGHITFTYHSTAVPFTEAQIDFANKLLPAVSLALENARLYASQRVIADTLQEALLTIPQRIPGIEFGYLYRSATGATKVGGDFYDLFELEHGEVGITLGDVSGKGLEAATLTSVVRNTIRAYALEGYSPSEVMAKTNDAVVAATDSTSFITTVFAVLDTDTGKLIYCSAGHPPPVVQRASGVELLKEHSPIIGAFSGISYTEAQTNLQKGDILILYTDGVTEARCDKGFYGEDKLVNFVMKAKGVPVKEMPEAIFSNAAECSGGNLLDDIAILTVSWSGKSHS